MFDITFLPATIGDAIWVSYGSGDKRHHILIDGGTRGTRKYIAKMVKALPEDQRHIELVVVTHYDKDHIGGVLSILERDELKASIGEVWFNAYSHLPDDGEEESFGALQAEALATQILTKQLPWNKHFEGKAVSVSEEGGVPVIDLPGGMKLMLLSPSPASLAELRQKWEDELSDEGIDPGSGEVIGGGAEEEEALEPGVESFGAGDAPDMDALLEVPFVGDKSPANGSSIAFVAEFEGKRALFAADAHVPQLINSIDRLLPGGKLPLDLFKISHHGSKGTVSRELIAKVDCKRFVFSTNGSIFNHPDHESIARVLAEAGDNPELLFNYLSPDNKIWGVQAIQQMHGYTARFPEEGDSGLIVSL